MGKYSQSGKSNRYAPYIAAAKKVGGAAVCTAARAALRRWRAKAKPNRNGRLNRQIAPVGTGSSQSFFSKRYKARLPIKVLKNLAPVRVTVQTSSESLRTVAYGKQKATAVLQFPCSQLTNFFTNLVDSNSSNTQSMLLRSIEQEYMISNASSTNVFLKIYEVTARNDFTASTNSATLGAAINTPHGAFDQGIYDINSGMDAMTLGVTPFQSQLFTQMYKVDKIYHIELGAGRTHKHLSRFSPNAIVHEPRTSRNHILEKLTRGVLILAFGSPINDTTTASSVSTSIVALNMVRKETSKIQFMNPQGAVYYNQQALGTVAQGEHIDEEGNVQNEVET